MEREFAIEFLLLIDIFYLCFYISSKAHWALYYCLIKRHRRRHNDKWTDALTRIASLCSDWHFSGAQKRKWMKPGELWGKLGFILVTLFELEQFVSTFICFYSFPLFHFFLFFDGVFFFYFAEWAKEYRLLSSFVRQDFMLV